MERRRWIFTFFAEINPFGNGDRKGGRREEKEDEGRKEKGYCYQGDRKVIMASPEQSACQFGNWAGRKLSFSYLKDFCHVSYLIGCPVDIPMMIMDFCTEFRTKKMGAEDWHCDSLFKKSFLFYLCVIEWFLWGSMHVCVCPRRPEKGVPSLGTGVLANVSCLMLMLGIDLIFSGREVSDLKYWDISKAEGLTLTR